MSKSREEKIPVAYVQDKNKYKLSKKLGEGCFGAVYLGSYEESEGKQREVAIKLEDSSSQAPQLELEAQLLEHLRGKDNPQGIAELFCFKKEESTDKKKVWNCLVMELLGKSLEDMLQKQKGKFNNKTTALIAQQVLHRIEYLHSKKYVHRDIKPENFMFGAHERITHVYIIDFGLSKQYWTANGHCKFRNKQSLTGTARYASIPAHQGAEQGRRDDLEAIAHMLIYFLRGAVPWSGLDAKTKEEKYRKIMEKKQQFPLDELCQGFPNAFKWYLEISRKMEFTERPDYDLIQDKFADVLKEEKKLGLGYPEFSWLEANPKNKDDFDPIRPRKPKGSEGSIKQPDDTEQPVPQASAGSKKTGRGGMCSCLKGSSVRD